MMLSIPVQQAVTDPRSVAITIEPCPYCGTHETPEDRDGVISCVNCGYPFGQDVLLIEEWETLITDQAEPLDETGWMHLLQQAECLC
jgi:hypothetical protein